MADTQLMRLYLNIITKCGMIPDGCREWRMKPVSAQTRAAFKTHFVMHDRDRLETATAASAGYHGAALAVGPVQSSTAETILAPPAATLAATVLPSGAELVVLITELVAFRSASESNAPSVP
jgi:hypothetical protein